MPGANRGLGISTYREVQQTGVGGRSEDPGYVNDARLMSAECRGTFAVVRGWLYNRMAMIDSFDGSGWTIDQEKGRRAAKEYLPLNRSRRDMDAPAFVDLDVSSATRSVKRRKL